MSQESHVSQKLAIMETVLGGSLPIVEAKNIKNKNVFHNAGKRIFLGIFNSFWFLRGSVLDLLKLYDKNWAINFLADVINV